MDQMWPNVSGHFTLPCSCASHAAPVLLPFKLSPSHNPLDSVDLYRSSPSSESSPPLIPFLQRQRLPPSPHPPLTPLPSPPSMRIGMFSTQQPSSRSENLLREALLKDEIQRGRDRERERMEEREHHHLHEPCQEGQHHTQPRRASFQRSYTEGTLPSLPRATSLSPTRRPYTPGHHKTPSHPLPHSHSESPYDQILRARMDRVLSSCHSHTSRDNKRVSLPTTPHVGADTGAGGRLGWFWREDAEEEGGELGRGSACECEYDWGKGRHEGRNSSSERESSGLVTPEDTSLMLAHAAGDSHPSINIKTRARSHTDPTAPSRPFSPRSRTFTGSKDPSSTSSPRSSWVIPLETVYSGEDTVPGVGAMERGKGEDGLLDTTLIHPPTAPGPEFSRFEPENGVLHMKSNPRHRRTNTVSGLPSHSFSDRPQQAQSYSHSHLSALVSPGAPQRSSMSSSKTKARLRALSARDPSTSSGSGSDGSGSDPASPTSCRSLPLPLPSSNPLSKEAQRSEPQPQLQPRTHSSPSSHNSGSTNAAGAGTPLNPRKFNVRTASAQCKQLDGYVSFMAVEGLGDPGPETDIDVEEKKGRKSRWLLF